MKEGLVIDLFAGGGGASTGIEAALGRPVDLAINHDPVALAVHRANHPATRHFEEDIWKADPAGVTEGRPVAILWASPDCTHFSVAKGGKPRKHGIRSLAWAVVRWAKATKPAAIFLENVTEFKSWGPLTRAGLPDKRFMGRTFHAWRRALERLGYVVEYRTLDASLYGAPTKRRRLFIIARRDGKPIVWPTCTHGPGRLPLHTAAEVIDWSLPCPSIFERKRPLRPKTQWRIAQGIRKFVLEAPEPFIIQVAHGKLESRFEPLTAPLTTVTAERRGHALVTPFMAATGGPEYGGAPQPADEPLPTVMPRAHRVIVAPSLVQVNHGVDAKTGPREHSLEQPLRTIAAGGNSHALVAPTLVEMNADNKPRSVEAPLGVVTSQHNRFNLAAATLVQTGYGEREGQAARVPGLGKPLGTVVAGGQKHARLAAFIAKHFGERSGGFVGGQQLDLPLGTITTQDHNSLAAATLMRFNHDDCGLPVDAPLPTITAQSFHLAEVRAFLTAYYSTDWSKGKGQALTEPLRAVPSKDRFGLVTVQGADYQIVDIGMRMLEPHELLRAQFGRYAAGYDLGPAKTKAAKVRLIGNSVCPEVAEAIVRANAEALARTAAVA